MNRHSLPLSHSMDMQGTSSGGLSRISFNRLSDQDPWIDLFSGSQTGPVTHPGPFTWATTIPDGRAVSLRIASSTEKTSPSMTFSVEGEDSYMFHRFVGCALMLSMPAEGVPEAFETLRDTWDFWRNKPLPSPTVTRDSLAKVISSGVRPEMTITE